MIMNPQTVGVINSEGVSFADTIVGNKTAKVALGY
jgi:hypothetical protein